MIQGEPIPEDDTEDDVSTPEPALFLRIEQGAFSGKFSIVFDTIAAESQRQMNEIYSAYIRGRLPKYVFLQQSGGHVSLVLRSGKSDDA